LANFVESFCPVSNVLGSLPVLQDDFQFISEIGRGGTGVVYEAKDTKLNRMVAIKVPFAQKSNILREAKTLSRLEHPNIAPIYQSGQIGGLNFIAMKFIEGEPLKAYCRNPPLLDPVRAARIVAETLDAIVACHSRGVVHLDLTPSNILLNEKSQPIVVDFGLASSVFGIRQQLGSPGYMSPELFDDSSVDSPILCDIFSLGVVLYELLTGCKPYGKKIPSLSHPPRRCTDYSDRNVHAELDKICLKAIAVDPDMRFQTAQGFQAALHDWISNHDRPGENSAFRTRLAADSIVGDSTLENSNRRQRRFNSGKLASFVASGLGSAVAFMLMFWTLGVGQSLPTVPRFGDQWRIQCFRDNVVDNAILPLGKLGAPDFAVRQDDYVKVDLEFDSKAYCYLIAANPNGSVQFLSQTYFQDHTIVFPERDDMYFKLNENSSLIHSSPILPQFNPSPPTYELLSNYRCAQTQFSLPLVLGDSKNAKCDCHHHFVLHLDAANLFCSASQPGVEGQTK